MASDRLPQERSQSVLETQERLLKAQAEQQAPTNRSNSSPQSSTPIGIINLTAAERAGVADGIGAHFSIRDAARCPYRVRG
nr:hypothetical protein [uncultured Roseococcus sp.]